MLNQTSRLSRFAALMCASLLIAVAGAPATAADCDRPLRPVLFIHGSGLDSSTWEPMRRAFLSAGYRRELLRAIDLRPNDGSNILAAEKQIAPAIDDLLGRAQAGARRAGCMAPTRLDLVTHSMGAVSARWYAARVAPAKVRNLIGIAPANHGSDALCALAGEGNIELCPAFAADSQRNVLQVQLNGGRGQPVDETPYGVGQDANGVASIPADDTRRIQYTTFRLEPDEWIVPAESAVLAGAGGLTLSGLPDGAKETSLGNVLWPAGLAHDELPGDPRLIGVIVKSLLQDVG